MNDDLKNAEPVLLCPGQGAQAVGMGSAWAASSPAARAIFDRADELVGDRFGESLSSICFNGPAELLNKTNVSQPALYTCGVACHAGLVEMNGPIAASAAAGLSLGEYTALHLAGVFDFETGLGLVIERGALMQAAAEDSSGSMVALMGPDEAAAMALCETTLAQLPEGEVLVPANFNAPGQIVLSGSEAACEAAITAAEEAGFRAKPLVVAGAFHSSLMAPAAGAMASCLEKAAFSEPRIPVWSNVSAAVHPTDDPEQIRRSLVEQITHPVRWAQSCSGMIAAGSTLFLELAPGRVLKGLMRRTDRDAKVVTNDEPAQTPAE